MEVKARSKRKDDLRAYLEGERQRLSRELAAEDVSTDEERAGYSNHMADDATVVFEQAKEAGLRRHHEKLLAEVDDALERMAAGTYGQCVCCGEAIDLARLKALPAAAMCLLCQTRMEQRQARDSARKVLS